MSKRKRTEVCEVIANTLRRDHDGLASLIAKGADVNQRDSDGRTALHHAVINGDEGIVQALLCANADVHIADSDGWTPLHFAARGYHLALAEVLLEAGADIEALDSHGNTPLFRATFESRGRGDMIQLLMRHGADAGHANKHGVSPAGLAATIANYDVAKWFESKR